MKKSDLGKRNDNTITVDILAWLMSGLFGILSGLFLVLGYQLENYDSINLTDKNALFIMFCIMAVFTVDTRYVWKNYDQALNGGKLFGILSIKGKKPSEKTKFKDYLMIWGSLIILNLPVLLAINPGFFVYDAQEELNEVLTRSFTTHHPLLHVLLLGGIIAFIHKITGSWNAGIFVYIFVQMLIITAIFAYIIGFMKERGIAARSRIIWICYYGLFPTIVMYTLCSSKDGLFSAFLLLLTVLLIQLCEDAEGFLANKYKCALFIAAAVLMPCFRHNGFYAYLVFVPIALIMLRKKIKKLLVALLITPVILYMIISTALAASLGASGTHNQEILTVPIMQMARVYTYQQESMTQEEIDTLKSYIPEENLDMYTPRVSDLVKIGFNNELYETNKGDFWKLWAELMVKHPMTYINAWFLTSYGYWYPPALINVYKGITVFTFTYENSSYFGYETELPGERHSLIPAIDELYRYLSIGTFHDDAPVLYLFFSPGLLMLIYLFVLFYRIYKKSVKGILPFLPIVLVWLTVLLGPTYLVRYVVILWTAFPLLMVTGEK